MKALQHPVVRFLLSVTIVASIVAVYHFVVHTNPATVGFTFLLAVLIVSASWGLRHAIFLSLVATLAYIFFFLPPVGTFTIADPQNWVALFTFLATAVIASQLSERARRETLNANRRRTELEQLYAFSQQMLATDNVLELVNGIPRSVIRNFGGTACGMFLTERKKVYYSDMSAHSLIADDDLKRTATFGESSGNREQGILIVPLRVGVKPVGALGIVGSNIGHDTLDAVTSLIAIAVERAGAERNWRTLKLVGKASASAPSCSIL